MRQSGLRGKIQPTAEMKEQCQVQMGEQRDRQKVVESAILQWGIKLSWSSRYWGFSSLPGTWTHIYVVLQVLDSMLFPAALSTYLTESRCAVG